MKSYVLGFLFSNSGMVWLINKTKPDWQKGKLNGIGGKIEPNETIDEAMRREFKEEANLDIDSWTWYCTLSDDESYEVFCFYAFSGETPKTMTEEMVGSYSAEFLPKTTIPNLHWLIPMALSFQKGESASRFHIKQIYELNKNNTMIH